MRQTPASCGRQAPSGVGRPLLGTATEARVAAAARRADVAACKLTPSALLSSIDCAYLHGIKLTTSAAA